MREFDTNGLRLCEYQAKLFEASVDRFDCSTSVFLRRFFYSKLLEKLDLNNSAIISLDINEGLDEIEEQFGKSDYGQIKRSKDSLFWLGYLYRYICYTRNVKTQFIMKTFKYDKLFELYEVYHTQDIEWCISNLLDLYNLTEYYFDNNYRFKYYLMEDYIKYNSKN